jgi:RNA-directed DNA polymerase
VDGRSFEAIERGEGIATVLRELAQDLKDKTYRAQPVRRVMMPTADGSRRPLGIPTIRDRVAQRAVKLIIEPICAADCCPNSYGFRPKKSAHDAVDDSATALWAGYTQVRDADLSQYVDSIPHAKLMAVVAERSVDGGILQLITLWLKAPVIGEDDKGVKRTVGGGKANRKGTPQGGVMSPLVANCSLHVLDRIGQRRHRKDKLQAHLGRYADDFVVMGRREVQEPLHVVRRVMERLGLSLNAAQTHIGDASQASCNFLGFFPMRMSRGLRTGKPSPQVCPADKSLMKIKTKLTELTGRALPPIPVEKSGENVNRSLRGWVNYFH